MHDVVIWHIGRCGSTVLSNLLNQHPTIQSENEIFQPFLLAKNRGEVIPTMDQVIADVAARKSKAIQAAEVKFLECQQPEAFGASVRQTLETFRAHGYSRFVVLHRANYLRRMVSHCVAGETRRFFVRIGDEAPLHRIVMNVNAIRVGSLSRSLLAWFEVFESAYQRLDELLQGHAVCKVSYEEDIEQNPLAGYAKVCRFLGQEPFPAQVSFQRTNPFRLADILHNYREVADLLQSTRHAWMLMEREAIVPVISASQPAG
jgi:LPS sulfotransferase NodH